MDGFTMSRIRSIHPGIWTDEAFMSLSAYGRLLLMGIWTEAFDDGVFEWKPLTLKARIFPVDMVDVNDLLAELVNQNLISRLESHPKRPGIIRNFQRYQRPKKPNSSGMLPDEWLDYVGAKAPPEAPDDDSSEPVPNRYGTSSEKPPQMEDGGWRMGSSLRSDQIEKETRERAEFSDWFHSWPSAASDDDDDAFRAWRELTDTERSEAKARSSAYVEAAKGGGRTAICSAGKYLRKRMWLRLAKVKPTATAPPKTPEERAAEKAAHIQSLIAHNKSW
ncbi:hypothetical protein [Rhizobium bangladeshense]|uniref:hypothetical protein n=1 Tax=Rhizobium bangladeshense TaxID=1138189 RepID=UPI001C837AEE|nr:hypothetical protein [Rhizobium bangladeshense]